METKRKIGPVTTTATGGVGLAGAVAIVIVWLLGNAGVEVPAEVAGAIAVIVGGIGSVIGGWSVKPGMPVIEESDGKHEAE